MPISKAGAIESLVLAFLVFAACLAVFLGIIRWVFRLDEGSIQRLLPGSARHRANQIAAWRDQAKEAWNRTAAIPLMLISGLIWVLLLLFFQYFLHAIQVPVGLGDTLIGSTAANLTQLLPINTFGSLGSLEAGWVGGFALVGIDPETALASGILMHALVLSLLGLLGLVSYLALQSSSAPLNRD